MSKFILILFFLTVSCSTNDEPKPGCFQDENRRIVGIIKEATGTVRYSLCGGNAFIIEPDKKTEISPMGRLFACNLNEEFRVDNAKIIFSGYLYESFDYEDICANHFEITEIHLANQ